MSIDSILSSFPGCLATIAIFYLALPRLLAVLPPKIQFVAKIMVVLFATMVMSVAGCFVAVACALLNRRDEINHRVAKIFSYLSTRPCNITFKIVGEENLKKTPAIVVCNHQSSMDMMVLGRVFPKNCVVMAKKEIQYFPFLGLYMTLSNAIFIDRKNHKKAIESTTQAVADMKKHNSGIWIFPEGTRSRFDKADLLPFKKGAFHLAIQSQLPVLPIVCAGYSHIYDSTRRSFPGGELEIRILDPIPTTGMTSEDVNDLMERTRAVMLKNLKEIDQSSTSSVESEKPKVEAKSTAPSVDKEDDVVEYDGVKKRKVAKA